MVKLRRQATNDDPPLPDVGEGTVLRLERMRGEWSDGHGENENKHSSSPPYCFFLIL